MVKLPIKLKADLKVDLTKPIDRVAETFQVAANFVGKIVGAPLEASVGLVSDTLQDFRAQNLERIALKWEQKIVDKGISQAAFQALPKGIGYRIIEACSIEENSEIQDLWAGLIASNVDGNQIEKFHIEILRALSPLEAKILKFQYLRYIEDDLKVSSLEYGPHSDFLNTEIGSIDARFRYLALLNLARMQCIRVLLSDYYLDIIDDSNSIQFRRALNDEERLRSVRRMLSDLSNPGDAVLYGDDGSSLTPELDFRITELGIDLMNLCVGA